MLTNPPILAPDLAIVLSPWLDRIVKEVNDIIQSLEKIDKMLEESKE